MRILCLNWRACGKMSRFYFHVFAPYVENNHEVALISILTTLSMGCKDAALRQIYLVELSSQMGSSSPDDTGIKTNFRSVCCAFLNCISKVDKDMCSGLSSESNGR